MKKIVFVLFVLFTQSSMGQQIISGNPSLDEAFKLIQGEGYLLPGEIMEVSGHVILPLIHGMVSACLDPKSLRPPYGA